MLFSTTAVLLAIVPLSIAATCNSSNALPYTAAENGGGSNSQSSIDAAFTTCTSNCGINGSCLLGCLNTACATHCEGKSTANCQTTCLSDVCKAFYGSGSDAPNPTALQTCYRAQGLGSRKRATFSCSSSQTCYSETNGNLFCLNTATGDYTDISGGQGNVETGAYTSANAVQASSTTKSSSATATGTGLSATTMTATLATASTSATPTSVASATGGSSVEKIHVNAVGVVGAMGLIIGLVL